ncbi:GNAT family N-acetyltransferase [Staphylococcus schleiferi]|nr:GNAT family N-acetyltransferase [Staphylococcus schleiferi]UXR55508.1 GNAT family N-acetyltransferase [Staphylococcus schleiferi]UXR57814.1 GNAT family N-acetyltransferase [Staphylococcus schleiferi]UXR60101.1 GNAT family N-acetyltransferase [Staphylococcus schleiferi]UXR62417.1 GNAT family N-acetyltransferase [Staphylococcus schleiferi]
MMEIQMNSIYTEGEIVESNERYTIYAKPSRPLAYDANKWIYHQMPDPLTLKADMLQQQVMHQNIGAAHLQFEFPENVKPKPSMMQFLRAQGFQLGCLELYVIEANMLRQLKGKPIRMTRVTTNHVEDFLQVASPLNLPYGEDYDAEFRDAVRKHIELGERPLNYYVAYLDDQPVGILNLIEKEGTVEIDGFAVAEQYRGQGIGSSMQAKVGEIAGKRPVILVADAEDTAKEMYIKQGYTYVSFQYSALKEHIDAHPSGSADLHI